MWEYKNVAPDLCHHGIKGMKWGVRRYQNKDGSLTPAGLKRYGQSYSGHIDQDGHAHLHENVPQSRNMESLTNDEIRARIERLRLEEEYRQTKRKTSSIARAAACVAVGASFVGSVNTLLSNTHHTYDEAAYLAGKGKELADKGKELSEKTVSVSGKINLP